MRVVTCRRYGPPEALRIEHLPRPIPAAREVRVRLRATTVTSADARIRGFRCPPIFWLPLRLAIGLRRPRRPVLGMEFAGVVDAVGAAVTGFRIGDPVFGIASAGAHAEWLTIREDAAIAPMPAGLRHAEAASLPFGALAALAFLRDVATLRAGEHVLVVGAAGGVGVFAVQLARHFGARVTAVCSAENRDLVRSLGATTVIDRARSDFTTGPARYDVILDTVGATDPVRCRRVLAAGGRHVLMSFGFAGLWHAVASRLRPGPRVICGYSGNDRADLLLVRELVEAGIIRPVIGLAMPLAEAVAAHRHVDSGRKRGSLVLTLDEAPSGPQLR